jgi:hypothetical protein
MEDCVRRLSWLAIPVLAGLVWGCGDSTGLTEADLVGTWNATAFKFSDFGDPVMDFDVIGMGGSAQIVIAANGTYTVTITIGAADVSTGTWVLQGSNVLILTQTGETDGTQMTVSLSGTTLTVHSTDVVFDFDDGRGEIPVKLDATFVKG